MTSFLASVTSIEEALLAVEAGADVIDLKDPARGALGALDASVARDIVSAIGDERMLSATAGDFPSMDPREVLAAAQYTANLGVDFVKIGFFGTARDVECVRALAPLAAQTRLVAVQFADLAPDPDLWERLAESQFAGVMLDTARKDGPGLRALLSDAQLLSFVHRAQGVGLIAGLAGRLRLTDISPLLELKPDYLGFRGALCTEHERSTKLDAQALRAVRLAIPQHSPSPFKRGVKSEMGTMGLLPG